jgi:hypothetical protein
MIDSTVQQGLGYAFIGFLGMAVGKVYDYFTSKLNSRVKELEEKHKECIDSHKQCEEDRAKDKVELIARDNKDRTDMQKQLDELKGHLFNRIDTINTSTTSTTTKS